MEHAKEALRQEEYHVNKQRRRAALAEACHADYFQASDRAGDGTRPWWSQAVDGGDSSSGSRVGVSCGSGEQHGKRKLEEA